MDGCGDGVDGGSWTDVETGWTVGDGRMWIGRWVGSGGAALFGLHRICRRRKWAVWAERYAHARHSQSRVDLSDTDVLL